MDFKIRIWENEWEVKGLGRETVAHEADIERSHSVVYWEVCELSLG
jgi:hypothetical protein